MRWPDELKDYLRREGPGKTISELVNLLRQEYGIGVMEQQVKSQLYNLNIPFKKRVKRDRWSTEDEEKLVQLYKKHTTSELSQIFGRSPAGIHWKCKKLGIQPLPFRRDKQVSRANGMNRLTDFMDGENTEEMEWLESEKKRFCSKNIETCIVANDAGERALFRR